MDDQFISFLQKISLSSTQRKDARTKYTGVCKKVHQLFYSTQYDGRTKLLFGSYKNYTAIAFPFPSDQDVDLLIKMDDETFEKYDKYSGNGQSALLGAVRAALKEKYTLTEKIRAWGKVVLVQMAEGTHNVEVLPAYEQPDGSFLIPNSENGGSWDSFDPRDETERFRISNSQTAGLTLNLCKMIKRWKNQVSGCSLKSYKIEKSVITFLESYDYESKPYSQLVCDFFSRLEAQVDETNKSFVETASSRAQKALSYEGEGKYESATEEWQKIFGKKVFPSRAKVYNSSRKFSSLNEDFIEEKFQILAGGYYKLHLQCEVDQDGFRKMLLSSLPILKKGKDLEFKITYCDVPQPYEIYWKVRNFGKEAENAGGLRGEIVKGSSTKKEHSAYYGEHFVECYIIKNGVCVARKEITVPIEILIHQHENI